MLSVVVFIQAGLISWAPAMNQTRNTSLNKIGFVPLRSTTVLYTLSWQKKIIVGHFGGF